MTNGIRRLIVLFILDISMRFLSLILIHSIPFECKYQIVSITPLVFVNAGEDSVMADDVVMPSTPIVAPIEEEELEETQLDVNVSKQSCAEEPLEIVVCTRVDRLAWDC